MSCKLDNFVQRLTDMWNYGSRKSRLLSQVRIDQRESLLRILSDNERREFRDFTEFHKTMAVLLVTDKSGNFRRYVGVRVGLVPEEANYVRPEFFNGLWPFYRLELVDNSHILSSGVRVCDINLKGGSQLSVPEGKKPCCRA